MKDHEIADLKRSLLFSNEKLNSLPDIHNSPIQVPYKSVAFANAPASTSTPAFPAGNDDPDTDDLEDQFLRSKKFKKMLSK